VKAEALMFRAFVARLRFDCAAGKEISLLPGRAMSSKVKNIVLADSMM